MYHIFFTHLSVNGHLGCFHVLPIVNRAAVNTGVHVSFRTMFFPRYVSRSGAGAYGSSIFSFLRSLLTVSVVGVPVYIPTSSVGGFSFLHTPSSIYFL